MGNDKPKNIQLPYDLFLSLLYIMEHINTDMFDESFKMQFDDAFYSLKSKQNSIEKREAYKGLIGANKFGDEDAQNNARAEYLRKKNQDF